MAAELIKEPIKIFYCYAHEDKAVRDELGLVLSRFTSLHNIRYSI